MPFHVAARGEDLRADLERRGDVAHPLLQHADAAGLLGRRALLGRRLRATVVGRLPRGPYQLEQFVAALANHARRQGADLFQLGRRGRGQRGERVQRLVGQDPAAWLIGGHRALFAPAGQRPCHRLLRWLQAPEPLESPPRIRGLGAVQARFFERGAFPGMPVSAAACLECRRKIGVQLQQVVHVVRRVGELRIGQRPPRPVGAGLSLVDRVPELAGDQFGIADLRRQAEQCSRHLRVEHRARHSAARVQQRLEVLAGRVQDLGSRPVGEHRVQRPEVEARQWIHQVAIGVARHLHQAQLRRVGALAHELGVEREARRALQAEHRGGECVVRRDQRGVAHRSGVLRVESRHRQRRVAQVQQFLRIFVDIVLWRRGPQDLPTSTLLLGVAVAAYVAVSAVQLALLGEPAATWFLFIVVDPLLLGAWVWLVLRLFSKPERFLQTASAVFGAGAVLGLALYLPLQLIATAFGQEPSSGLAQTFALLLVVTFALVTGRIIKLATDSNLFTGIAVSLTYFLLINYLVGVARGAGA